MFTRATLQMMDDDHRSTLAMLDRLARGVRAVPAGQPPQASFMPLARSIARHLTDEIEHHFRFEEDALFPRLAAHGEADMVALLVDEHASIRSTAADALPLLLAGAAGSLGHAGFAQLRPLALALVEGLGDHIQKEAAGLLPLVEQLLDEDVDRKLALAYSST